MPEKAKNERLAKENKQLLEIMNQNLAISKYILAKQPDDRILNQITGVLGVDAYILDSFGRLKAKNNGAAPITEVLDYTSADLDLINLEEPRTLFDRYTIYPLKTTDKLTRRFVILDVVPVKNSAEDLLISNMINLLSLESLQVQINVSNERERKSEVFETLMTEPIAKESFAGVLKLNGLDIHDQYRAFAVDEANSQNTGNHQFVMHRVSDYIYWYFNKINAPIVLINWHFKIFGLVKEDADLPQLLPDLEKFLLDHFPNERNLIGYTMYQKSIVNFQQLLDEADKALGTAKKRHLRAPHQYNPQQVTDVLRLIPKKEALIFVDAVLHPILESKSTDREQYLSLLVTFFSANESTAKAAEMLFIHRNTAFYRLQKIEKILGMDLGNADDNEKIHLAIQLYEIWY
ncbi:helix-turn-helix domain-containing protein [Leuconostocaceae bacterium ESL0723]|nr:helix-turn-helix domain-containing protein [Leuconostocaceae bacterium ESL0723]